MRVAKTLREFLFLRDLINDQVVGFVPTMGALHRGHLSLVDLARRQTDCVVVSIFVNPTQFGQGEDFQKYPRQLHADLELLQETGNVDLVFCPESADEMFPSGCNTVVQLGPEIDQMHEARKRPGHFTGVATVVTKLFNIVRPHRAYFGQKDAAQCVAIRKLVSDLNYGPVLEVVVGETVRDGDGLPLSSRNVYMTQEERRVAPAIYVGLQAGQNMFNQALERGEEIDADVIREHVQRSVLSEAEKVGPLGVQIEYSIEYVSLMDMDTGMECSGPIHHLQSSRGRVLVLSAAMQFNQSKLRIIDNVLLEG